MVDMVQMPQQPWLVNRQASLRSSSSNLQIHKAALESALLGKSLPTVCPSSQRFYHTTTWYSLPKAARENLVDKEVMANLDGRAGQAQQLPNMPMLRFVRWMILNTTHWRLQNGAAGGRGGNAGRGSNGGPGGAGGTVHIRVMADALHLLLASSWNVNGGAGGHPGQHGQPGPGGAGGSGGAKHIWQRAS